MYLSKVVGKHNGEGRHEARNVVQSFKAKAKYSIYEHSFVLGSSSGVYTIACTGTKNINVNTQVQGNRALIKS